MPTPGSSSDCQTTPIRLGRWVVCDLRTASDQLQHVTLMSRVLMLLSHNVTTLGLVLHIFTVKHLNIFE